MLVSITNTLDAQFHWLAYFSCKSLAWVDLLILSAGRLPCGPLDSKFPTVSWPMRIEYREKLLHSISDTYYSTCKHLTAREAVNWSPAACPGKSGIRFGEYLAASTHLKKKNIGEFTGFRDNTKLLLCLIIYIYTYWEKERWTDQLNNFQNSETKPQIYGNLIYGGKNISDK